jgi:signal transduction histidine kinase
MTGREGVCHVSCSVYNPDDAGNSILFLLDITHSKLTEERFSDLTGKLRDLSGHIESGMEAERKRLAREIHDGLGSSLSALKMELSVMKRRLKASTQPEVIPVIENGLEAITGQIDSMVDLVRKLVTELRPGVLDELGLLATVRWFAADFQKRTGLEVAVNVYPDDFSLDPNLSTAIFRILQEVMTNIQKHAAASRVVIFLRKQNHQFQMRIRDDGIGIGEKALNNKRSFGIIGMQERIRLLRGKLSITGEKDKGTTVFIEIPIEKP